MRREEAGCVRQRVAGDRWAAGAWVRLALSGAERSVQRPRSFLAVGARSCRLKFAVERPVFRQRRRRRAEGSGGCFPQRPHAARRRRQAEGLAALFRRAPKPTRCSRQPDAATSLAPDGSHPRRKSKSRRPRSVVVFRHSSLDESRPGTSPKFKQKAPALGKTNGSRAALGRTARASPTACPARPERNPPIRPLPAAGRCCRLRTRKPSSLCTRLGSAF